MRPTLTPKTSSATLVLTVVALLTAGTLVAGEFPQTVPYQGQATDALGAPLGGSHDLELTYFDPDGDQLFAERIDGVDFADGRFRITLGSGNALAGSGHESLAAVFAGHPDVHLEIAVSGETFGPRVSILPAGHSLESRLVLGGLRPPSDDNLHWKHYEAPSGATSVQSAVLAPAASRRGGGGLFDDPNFRTRPYTLPVVGPSLSPPVRSLPRVDQVKGLVVPDVEVNRPRHETLFDKNGNRFGTAAPKMDDMPAATRAPQAMTPALNNDFEGINNVNGVLPPDTEGTVGPNHYVQVVNLSFAVYDKSGTLLTGPSNTNTLWAGFGGPCQTDNSGDAIFLYDEAADRYVLTQFAVGGSNQSVCWAVSQTPDPTGAYYRYEVVTPRFPDYYKVGVWPDPANNAYFFGTNSGFQGQYDVFAVDRANMLIGAAARPMQFFQNFVNLMMPADLDGYDRGGTNPGAGAPPSGSPGIFYTFRDGGESYFSNPPTDSIDIWEFDVDWNTPSNSSFSLATSITPAQGLQDFNWTVCGFFVSNCLPQPGTGQGIDSASWWPMQRLVYRKFDTYEALVGTWTVDVLAAGNRAAPRWFELRDTGSGWTMYQQGTHSPDATHRFMPSIAMDGSGNIAIGYSVTDSSTFPSIYYATRDAGDPLGTLQNEALMFAGSGSQTSTSARWGDYSSMELDPADDCTFWFTTEYLATTGGAPWRTRVGNFTVPGCGGPPVPGFTLSCTPSSFTLEEGQNDTSTCTVTSVNGFADPVSLSCAGEPAGSSCNFSPASATPTYNSTLTLNTGTAAPGSYNFDVEATDGTTTKTFAISLTVTPAGQNGPQDAVYNGTYQAPACLTAGTECDSLALIEARDNVGPEPNQPNTIFNSCADGSTGTYLVDESIESMIVRTLDGFDMVEGATVEIEVTVFAWNTGSADTLDLYYAADANSPSWVYIGSQVPPGGSFQTMTAQYTLPAGALQAVRAQFRYQGSASTCTAGAYNDRDDLVFAVKPPGPVCTVDADCDDGLFCNGDEVCNAGTCEAGTAPTCDDGVSCTDDSCNEGTDSCDNVTNDANCDNGLFCDGSETCDAVLDCQPGTAPDCDDGVSCTNDSCNEGTDSCDNVADNGNCDDGAFCNGSETCDPVLDCQAGTAPNCDDGVGCTVDSCNEGTDSCDNAPNDGLCSNGQFCDGTETCDPVLDCQAGTDPCPGQSCDEGTDSCVACIVDADCDDGAFCNGSETCNAGVCQAGTPVNPDDGVSCTVDSCDEVNNTVVNAPNDSLCDNGLFCDGSETCDAVLDCQSGTAPNCDDGVSCTDDSCNEGTDSCDNVTNDANCDNGLFCDGSETCDAVLDCQPGSDPCDPLACDEGTDSCVGGGGDPVYWMSFRSNTAVPGVGTVTDDDIVSYDSGSGLWTKEFDGSDIGLSSFEIDGLAILPGGDLLLSFRQAGTAAGLTFDDSDVVRFTGTGGNNTSGTFSMYLDGSDVGLTGNGEDLDAIALDASGNLIVSSQGGFSGSGASGSDEDLFRFTGTTGPNTSGSFTRIFDGSDVGLGGNGSADVDAAALTSAGLLQFSTVGTFSFWTDEDVVEFSGPLSDPTSGSFSMDLDLSTLGIASGEDVGSLYVVD